MRVAVYPADQGACGAYRLIWPSRALIDQGHDVDLVLPSEPDERQLTGKIVKTGGVERLLKTRIPDADVMVIQRPARQVQIDAMTLIQDQGIPVVVEIDDDFRNVDPRNWAWVHVHPSWNPNRNWQILAEACKRADLVTVTTPALAKMYGSHGRVKVIPNYIPESYLKVEPEPHDGVLVGWAGHAGTHPRDLQVTRGGVEQALGDAHMVVVGDGQMVPEGLSLRQRHLLSVYGYVLLEEYPHAVANFDVGIVPLADTAFNRAKSALKMLEYAALGVASVVSPSPDNLRLHHDYGLGIVAAKQKDWTKSVGRLVRDAGYREYQADMGRAQAESLTIEGNARLWWDAWTSTLR